MQSSCTQSALETTNARFLIVASTRCRKMAHCVIAENFDSISTDFHNYWETYTTGYLKQEDCINN